MVLAKQPQKLVPVLLLSCIWLLAHSCEALLPNVGAHLHTPHFREAKKKQQQLSLGNRRLLRRALKGPRPLIEYEALQYTLPTCMPLAGNVCALNSAYLLDVLKTTKTSISGLSPPELIYAKEAAALVLCPDLWDEECTASSMCKWEPEQMWCDIDPKYSHLNMYCEGSQAREYYECMLKDNVAACNNTEGCFSLSIGNATVQETICLPEFLLSPTDTNSTIGTNTTVDANTTNGSDDSSPPLGNSIDGAVPKNNSTLTMDELLSNLRIFEARLSRLPMDDDIYGCCPGNRLIVRYLSCSGFVNKTSCEQPAPGLGDVCIWDSHGVDADGVVTGRCTADPVKLILETFNKEVGKKLLEEADTCDAVPLAQCQSRLQFAAPEQQLLHEVLDAPLHNLDTCQSPQTEDSYYGDYTPPPMEDPGRGLLLQPPRPRNTAPRKPKPPARKVRVAKPSAKPPGQTPPATLETPPVPVKTPPAPVKAQPAKSQAPQRP